MFWKTGNLILFSNCYYCPKCYAPCVYLLGWAGYCFGSCLLEVHGSKLIWLFLTFLRGQESKEKRPLTNLLTKKPEKISSRTIIAQSNFYIFYQCDLKFDLDGGSLINLCECTPIENKKNT